MMKEMWIGMEDDFDIFVAISATFVVLSHPFSFN